MTKRGLACNLQYLIIFCSILFLSTILYAQQTYQDGGRRDPFLPLVSPEGYLLNWQPELNLSGINLEGIIYDKDGNSLVIINGEIFKKGENFADCKILEIYPDKVILAKGTQRFIVELREEAK